MLEWIKLGGRFLFDRRMRVRLLGYRPVVMCLIQATGSDKFLLIQPAAKPQAWMPPQEGVEATETIEDAACRGIAAELGVPENQLQFRRSTWVGKKKIAEQQGERDVEYSPVEMKGKAYYAALVKMAGDTELTMNPAEIAGSEWLTLEQIRERLATNSKRKQELIRTAFI
ncbi:MAG: NUDIX domain-containing protein [Aureliella sp.]